MSKTPSKALSARADDSRLVRKWIERVRSIPHYNPFSGIPGALASRQALCRQFGAEILPDFSDLQRLHSSWLSGKQLYPAPDCDDPDRPALSAIENLSKCPLLCSSCREDAIRALEHIADMLSDVENPRQFYSVEELTYRASTAHRPTSGGLQQKRPRGTRNNVDEPAPDLHVSKQTVGLARGADASPAIPEQLVVPEFGERGVVWVQRTKVRGSAPSTETLRTYRSKGRKAPGGSFGSPARLVGDPLPSSGA